MLCLPHLDTHIFKVRVYKHFKSTVASVKSYCCFCSQFGVYSLIFCGYEFVHPLHRAAHCMCRSMRRVLANHRPASLHSCVPLCTVARTASARLLRPALTWKPRKKCAFIFLSRISCVLLFLRVVVQRNLFLSANVSSFACT